MQTVEIDIDGINSPKDLAEMLKDQHLEVGDNLIMKADSQEAAMFIIIFVAVAFYSMFEQNRRKEDGEKVLMDLLGKYENAEELESEIEKEYGISIAFETKNPIEKAFGLWKDYDIDADTLRKKAWGKAK